MSFVTNVILAYGPCGNENDMELLAEINSHNHQGRVVHVEDECLPEDWFCNGKTLEVNLAIGAFNYLDLRQWINDIKRIDYRKYDCRFVQLIVAEEHDNGFGIVDIYRGDDYVAFDPTKYS